MFWLIFCATVFAASMIPGPSTLIAFTHGAMAGWRKAAATASGNALATVLQALAASAGLGLILIQSATLFLIIKYLGAAWLIWTGISLLRGRAQAISHHAVSDAVMFRRLFRSGFLIAAANPKAIVFFTALFPQFLDAEKAGVGAMAAMVALSGFIAFLVAMIYAGLGARLKAMRISRAAMGWVHKVTGGLFITGGVGLAVSRS